MTELKFTTDEGVAPSLQIDDGLEKFIREDPNIIVLSATVFSILGLQYNVADTTVKVDTVEKTGTAKQICVELNKLFKKANSGNGGPGEATTDASDLISGTLSNARLSEDVPLLQEGVLPENVLPRIYFSDQFSGEGTLEDKITLEGAGTSFTQDVVITKEDAQIIFDSGLGGNKFSIGMFEGSINVRVISPTGEFVSKPFQFDLDGNVIMGLDGGNIQIKSDIFADVLKDESNDYSPVSMRSSGKMANEFARLRYFNDDSVDVSAISSSDNIIVAIQKLNARLKALEAL